MSNLIMGTGALVLVGLLGVMVAMMVLPIDQKQMAIATTLSRKGPLTSAAFKEAMQDRKITEIEYNGIRNTAETSGEIYR